MPPRRPGGKYKGLVKKTKGEGTIAKEAEAQRKAQLERQAARAEEKRLLATKMKDASLKTQQEQELEVRKQRILNMLVGGRKGDLKKFFKSWVIGLVAVKAERILKERDRAWRCSCRICLDGAAPGTAHSMMCMIARPPFIVPARVVGKLLLNIMVSSTSNPQLVIATAFNLGKDAAFAGLLRQGLEAGFAGYAPEVEVLAVALDGSDRSVRLGYSVDFQATVASESGLPPGHPGHWTAKSEQVVRSLRSAAFATELQRALEGRQDWVQVKVADRKGLGQRPALRSLEDAFADHVAQVQVQHAEVASAQVLPPGSCGTDEMLQANSRMMPFDLLQQQRHREQWGLEGEESGGHGGRDVLTSLVRSATSLAKSSSLPSVGPSWSQKAIPKQPWAKDEAATATWLDSTKAIVASHAATGRRVLLDPVMMKTRFADEGVDRTIARRTVDSGRSDAAAMMTQLPGNARRDRRANTLTSALSMLKSERSTGTQHLTATLDLREGSEL